MVHHAREAQDRGCRTSPPALTISGGTDEDLAPPDRRPAAGQPCQHRPGRHRAEALAGSRRQATRHADRGQRQQGRLRRIRHGQHQLPLRPGRVAAAVPGNEGRADPRQARSVAAADPVQGRRRPQGEPQQLLLPALRARRPGLLSLGRPGVLRLHPQGAEGLRGRADGLWQADPQRLLRGRRGEAGGNPAAEDLQRPARAVQQADGERHRGLCDDRRPRGAGAHGRRRSEVRLQRQAAERHRRHHPAEEPRDRRTDHQPQADRRRQV
ncbi:hypothetical protein D9M69_323880 [compost metagenome]